jgi:small-conductance mechanosensitive channel
MRIITPLQKRYQKIIAAVLLGLAAFLTVSAVKGAATPIDRDAILAHLNTIISWYRDSGSKIQSVGLPSDAIYQDTSQNLAQQAVRLAFQAAQAAAALTNASDQSTAPASADAPGGSTQQNLAQTLATLKSRIDQDQSQLDDVNKKLATAPPSKRQSLTAQRDSLQGEIALDQATLDAVQKLATFVESNEESGVGGFSGSINDLARTVPEILGDANAQKAAAKPAATQPTISKSSGLIGQALTLYTDLRTMHNIDQLANETERVHDNAAALRKPMRDTLAATIQHGRDLTSQTPPSDPAQAKAAQLELRSLTGQFKQLSNVVIPLSQEMMVLDQSRANFLNWRNSIARESKDSLRSVVSSAVAILLALGIVWALSEIWRRWTFRYIHDLRRRRQFMLLRRFVMGFLICAVLTLGIVSDFSSLATFAGFATAGIAVGLQAVLLSVAAYFFVIGRYGIRIGDRVSIAGVTGDVIDVSPVRFYLMELAGSDVNLFPTGRIVVFSNAVLFQATTPLFKQIPGTEYTWHEVVLQLVAGADYNLAEEKLLAAVNTVYDKYKEDIARQHNDLERRIEIQMKPPTPQAKLHYSDTALEFLVRYPTELRTAPEIDEEVIKAVLDAIEKDPKLKAAVTGWPRIRAAVKV